MHNSLSDTVLVVFFPKAIVGGRLFIPLGRVCTRHYLS
jgi:hypothetical protein